MAEQDLTTAQTYDITYYRGSTVELSIAVTDTDTGSEIDLTGYTIEIDIKQNKRANHALVSFTTADNSITISGNTYSWTMELDIPDGVHYWDCKVTKPDGTIEYWWKGSPTVERNVT